MIVYIKISNVLLWNYHNLICNFVIADTVCFYKNKSFEWRGLKKSEFPEEYSRIPGGFYCWFIIADLCFWYLKEWIEYPAGKWSVLVLVGLRETAAHWYEFRDTDDLSSAKVDFLFIRILGFLFRCPQSKTQFG